MKLLRVETIQVESFEGNETPRYAILSHTWGHEEVSFQQIHHPNALNQAGYAKIRGACQQAIKDGLQYVWIDTCCIDKTSNSELSEAINSMFRWYMEAVVCYVYLADVALEANGHAPGSAFETSRWWTRGWTLQELLAPPVLKFYERSWQQTLGTKHSLSTKIASITGISETILRGESQISEASIARRMSWASSRTTSRKEDIAYCLLGIFGINMPLLYGEGDNAFIRLQEEIMKYSDDQTLFIWTYPEPSLGRYQLQGPFAPGPFAFNLAKNVIPDELREFGRPYAMTNLGLQISLHIVHSTRLDAPIAIFACRLPSEYQHILGVPVKIHNNSSFSRLGTSRVVRISRDEQTTAINTYYFLRNHTISSLIPEGTTSMDVYLLRKTTSHISIWKIEPAGSFRRGQGVIHSGCRAIIYMNGNKFGRFTIKLFHGNADICYEPRYPSSKVVTPDTPIVTIGEPRRVVGLGIVRLVDIEDSRDWEIKLES